MGLLTKVGPYGLIAWLLWYVITKLFPRILDRFHTMLREERTKIDELSKRMDARDKGHEDRFNLIMQALNQNVMAVKFLVAKLTNVDFNASDMGDLVCPHDGKACADQKKQEAHKELVSGANKRGGPATTATLGP